MADEHAARAGVERCYVLPSGECVSPFDCIHGPALSLEQLREALNVERGAETGLTEEAWRDGYRRGVTEYDTVVSHKRPHDSSCNACALFARIAAEKIVPERFAARPDSGSGTADTVDGRQLSGMALIRAAFAAEAQELNKRSESTVFDIATETGRARLEQLLTQLEWIRAARRASSAGTPSAPNHAQEYDWPQLAKGLNDVINWALGETGAFIDLPEGRAPGDGKKPRIGRFYWRTELRRRRDEIVNKSSGQRP